MAQGTCCPAGPRGLPGPSARIAEPAQSASGPIRRTGRAGGPAPAAPGMIPTISPDASGDKMS